MNLSLGLGMHNNLGIPAYRLRAPFTSTWKTDNTGTSTDTQITLPLVSTGTYDFVANWGDGTSDTITAYDQAEVTHTYSTAGTYTVKIYGTIEGWQFDDGGDKLKLTNISQFGNLDITTDAAFYGCSNMTITATDAPDISSTSLLNMFRDCSSITTLPSLGNFDTSQVTNMYCMFYGCSSFNQSVSNFDTSQVTNMGYMFFGCSSFNQSVSNFDTSQVTDMRYMFFGCSSFNQSVSNFDTSQVTNMDHMFYGCSSFNQSVSNFDTSQVTNMYGMFYGCSSFNQSVSNFDTSQVTNMGYMFDGCDSMSSANLGTVKDWTITALTDAENFMAGCTNSMSTADYDALLIAWEGQTHYTGAANTMPIHFNNATYTAGGAAEAARTALVNDGWDITDGGVAE
jgi:surface protein